MTDHLVEIRSLHPAAFRSGEWARIIATVRAEASDLDRDCYLVEFADGQTDWWVVDDPGAMYEFDPVPA